MLFSSRIIAALSLAAALVAAWCPVVMANPGMGAKNNEARFAAMDADKDGQVSRKEFFAAYPQMKEGAFTAIDTDADASLTLEEWKEFTTGHGRDGKGASMTGPRSVNATGNGDAKAVNATKASPSGKAPSLVMPSGDVK